jgi:hypothetical protein
MSLFAMRVECMCFGLSGNSLNMFALPPIASGSSAHAAHSTTAAIEAIAACRRSQHRRLALALSPGKPH